MHINFAFVLKRHKLFCFVESPHSHEWEMVGIIVIHWTNWWTSASLFSNVTPALSWVVLFLFYTTKHLPLSFSPCLIPCFSCFSLCSMWWRCWVSCQMMWRQTTLGRVKISNCGWRALRRKRSCLALSCVMLRTSATQGAPSTPRSVSHSSSVLQSQSHGELCLYELDYPVETTYYVTKII